MPLKRENRLVKDNSGAKSDMSGDSFATDESVHFEEDFIYLGLKNGEVVVIKIDFSDYLHARFVIENKHSIEKIVQQEDQDIFLTVSERHCLKIWGFEQNKVQIYQSFDIFRPILSIHFFEESILLAHKDGDLILFAWEFKD